MNENTGKTASCSAITEKRAHRPGGCIGIFFQLIDWNRRFAKKKLFSRRLLPLARGKQVSNKFGGDEKMPKTKLHLIANENSGGFPNVKKNGNRSSVVDLETKHEMKAPSLVARLMGLESMPTVPKDNPKKPSLVDSCDVRVEKFVNEHSGREDLSLEKGGARIESRPQKIQKTGQSERMAVTRFKAEALQIKSVLSRSRKLQSKFASPVKSPRVSLARNVSRTSRLIDAATKILEPGLQATNRAKSALTFSSSTHNTVSNEDFTEARLGVMSPELSKQSGYTMSAGKSLMAQTSCRNCGNFLDVVDCQPNIEEQSFVCSSPASNLVNISSQGSGKSKSKLSVSSMDRERVVNFQQCDQPISLNAVENDNCNTQSVRTPSQDRKSPLQVGQAQWHLTSQHGKPLKEEPSFFNFKQKTQNQNRVSLEGDRISSRAKLSNLQSKRVSSPVNNVSGAKDSVSLNQSASGRIQARVPAKLENSSSAAERKSFNQQDDTLLQARTPVRKRRTVGVNGQVESTGFANSMLEKQRNVRCDVGNGKEISRNARSVDQNSAKSRAARHRDGSRPSGNKESNVISFTFNSPIRHRNSTEVKEQIKEENDCASRNAYQQKLVDGNYGSSQQKQWPLRGDALGALLEEKLKELTLQEDNLIAAGSSPKRSTAMILQELISALTTDQPIPQEGHVSDTDVAFQTKAKTKGTLVEFARDGDHLSPGSVLEASLLNDSCFSSSIDNSSAHRLNLDSMDYSQDQLQPAETYTDLLDSATSLNKGRAGDQTVIELINQISRFLHSINYAGLGLTGSKLTYAKDVILNAELLFGNTSLLGEVRDFLVSSVVLDELEVLATAMWPNFNCLLGFEETKESVQLRGFLFDCVIECFDVKYVRHCNSGFKAWTRLPLRMKAEMLIREVGEEVIRWTHSAGMTPDEVIECEMSHHSLGKWTEFDIETFETGAEIGLDILQILVEETVMDIWERKCFCIS